MSAPEFEFQPEHDGTLSRESMVMQALGAASMCWEHPERAGVFQDGRAKAIGEKLLAALNAEPRVWLEGQEIPAGTLTWNGEEDPFDGPELRWSDEPWSCNWDAVEVRVDLAACRAALEDAQNAYDDADGAS